MWTQIRIGNRGFRLIARKPAQQLRIGSELRWSAIELPRMTQHHPVAPMHRSHHAANVHIAIAELAQLADLTAILAEAHDCESAFVIGSIRRAYIQKPRPIRQFHYVVNMRIDARVFIHKFRNRIWRNASLWLRRKTKLSDNDQNQQDPRTTESHKSLSGESNFSISCKEQPIKFIDHTPSIFAIVQSPIYTSIVRGP